MMSLETMRANWQREREIDHSDADTMEAAEAYIAALEADRAQRPALETWEVFTEAHPHDAVTFKCDQEAAEEIARSYSADENNCGAIYTARKVA